MCDFWNTYYCAMDMHKRFRTSSLIITFIAAFAVSGCQENAPTENPVLVPEEPAPCTASALCRLQNPADTILLSPDQKEKTVSLLETIQDTTTVVALTSIDLSALGSDTLRIKLLKDRQVSVHTPTFRVPGILAPDSTIRYGWRGEFGMVADSGYGFVDLTYKNGVIENGFAVVGGKYLSLEPLGGSTVAVVYVKDMIWMGECPPYNATSAKTSAVQLTCAVNVIP